MEKLLVESSPKPFLYALALFFIFLVKIGIITEGDEDEDVYDQCQNMERSNTIKYGRARHKTTQMVN